VQGAGRALWEGLEEERMWTSGLVVVLWLAAVDASVDGVVMQLGSLVLEWGQLTHSIYLPPLRRDRAADCVCRLRTRQTGDDVVHDA
jgi:hypothetical protein